MLHDGVGHRFSLNPIGARLAAIEIAVRQVMEIIKGLKGKARLVDGGGKWVEKGENVWIEKVGDGDAAKKVRMLFVPDGGDMPKATHRLGIAIGGNAGLVIHDVSDDSAAAAAGVEAGDILLAVDGENIESVGDLIGRVNQAGESGEGMKLMVVRGDDVMVLRAKPKEVPHEHEDHDEHGHHEHDHDHGEHHTHKQALERAREMAELAAEIRERVQAELRERQAEIPEAMRKAQRQMREHLRDIEREVRQRDEDEMDKLREEIRDLRQMVRELKEDMGDE